jgi:hypothetical protein
MTAALQKAFCALQSLNRLTQDRTSRLNSADSLSVPGAPPRPDAGEAPARAHNRWKRLMESRCDRSSAALAKAEKIDRSYLGKMMRLTLPALASWTRSKAAAAVRCCSSSTPSRLAGRSNAFFTQPKAVLRPSSMPSDDVADALQVGYLAAVSPQPIEPAWAILNLTSVRSALSPAALANLSKCTQAGSISH